MLIFARQALVPDQVAAGSRALLLEGDWDWSLDAGPLRECVSKESLDTHFDQRNKWIDARAHELAEMALSDLRFLFANAASGEQLNAADVFALKLRYAFVKWLRVAAFMARTNAVQRATLFVDTCSFPGDSEYVALLKSTSKIAPFELTIHDAAACQTLDVSSATASERKSAKRHAWRSWAQRLSQVLRPRAKNLPSAMFLGNPRILDPICAEFAQRGIRPAWLREEFAPRSWLKWRRHGGEQFVIGCGGAAISNAPSSVTFSSPKNGSQKYESRGIDLMPCLSGFLRRQVETHGADARHASGRMVTAMRSFRPKCLVVDEDATPRKRVAVGAAARLGIPTFVVQHGVPRLQFGFAPLAADCLLCWGELSRRRLADFGIPQDRLATTGRADWQPPAIRNRQPKPNEPLRLLLIGTTPPRDDRPEPVGFHLTSTTHRQLLRTAFAAAAEIPQVQLVIKRHPRCSSDTQYRELQTLYPNLNCTVTQHVDVNELIATNDVVLNVASGAGVEAAAAGAKVIELIPTGGAELLPAVNWSAIGAATTKDEILHLIDIARLPNGTKSGKQHIAPGIFAATGRQAARKAVNEIMARLNAVTAGRLREVTAPISPAHSSVVAASDSREVV